MDSFGIQMPDRLLKLCKYQTVCYNTHHIQNIKSSNCGFYCIYFILELFNNIEPLDIILQFQNNGILKNDLILKQLLNKYI